MADNPLDELKKRAENIVAGMNKVAAEPNVDKQTEMINQIAGEAKELDELGKRYVMSEQKRMGRGYVQVVLTPEQQKRILAKTGVKMDILTIEDSVGAMNESMPINPKELIEKFALDEALRRKQGAEAEERVRKEVERTIADLERQQNSDINAHLDRMRADPNFMNGVLNKKKPE